MGEPVTDWPHWTAVSRERNVGSHFMSLGPRIGAFFFVSHKYINRKSIENSLAVGRNGGFEVGFSLAYACRLFFLLFKLLFWANVARACSSRPMLFGPRLPEASVSRTGNSYPPASSKGSVQS